MPRDVFSRRRNARRWYPFLLLQNITICVLAYCAYLRLNGAWTSLTVEQNM